MESHDSEKLGDPSRTSTAIYFINLAWQTIVWGGYDGIQLFTALANCRPWLHEYSLRLAEGRPAIAD
jgi:hypothetical protein